MPLFGVSQSGGNPIAGLNLTDLIPGDAMVLFDGTETPASGLKSVAFARGPGPVGADNGTTFTLRGIPTGMTVDVQVASGSFASVAAMDAAFTTVATLSPSTTPDTGNAAYTDVGRSAFYRLYMSAFTSGAMPVATATR